MAKRRHKVIARTYNKRGHLLAVATNSFTKTHPLQAKYAERTGRNEAIYLHAEIRALLKSREQVYKMEILRMNANGMPVLAKPCAACALALAEFKVKEIIHT